MHRSATPSPPRPEIALSWQRSRMSGLSPSTPAVRVDPDAVDTGGRLATAARPVLAELAEHLGDLAFCVVLADRASRIVAPTVGGNGGLRTLLEGLGVVAGGVFLEETTGTNSIATVHEVRRGLAVHGDEHYLEPFRQFSCYGHPITHPVTRRLEGVLDITCLRRDDSPLLGPFLAKAARDVEERLLRSARVTEQRLLAAFQVASAGRRGPVLVLGEGVVLANPAAAELLDPVDHLRLRELAAGLPRRGGGECRTADVTLSSGCTRAVRFRALDAGAEGALFEFDEPDAPRRGFARPSSVRPPEAAPGSPVWIGGAPGTGRTAAAHRLAADAGAGVVTLDGSEAAAYGAAGWLAALGEAARTARTGGDLLLVEEAHLLPDVCAVRLRRLLERPDRPWTALTGPPARELTGGSAALAAGCPERIGLRPLRERAEELPTLVQAMTRDAGSGGLVRFTPAALAALAGHPWPGNLRELDTVVRAVLERRSAGDVTPGDLPDGYRVSPRLPAMTPLERAEHDAITAALSACGGNKLRTARQLGISRTTLYNRMRVLRITV
ncbi:sigma-54-dependent Fis family transcriptional regulator [Streptomyces sp. NPDC057638]|uniref:sigma-54-dependent Fis family transcriptional regulator n=1 Tax=Streptomyces sp. NPDC057638 TaxID=3346190 RepID=UPI0036844110